jgi:hypothetical protein
MILYPARASVVEIYEIVGMGYELGFIREKSDVAQASLPANN